MKLVFCYFSLGLFLLYMRMSTAYSSETHTVYLIPGHGSDQRLFSKLDLGEYHTQVIHHEIPLKGESFEKYVKRLILQIDTTQSFSIVGVSLGGIIATEMTRYIHPERVILISSAKCRGELPLRYRMFRYFPIHYLMGGKFLKWWGLKLQPIIEPVDSADQALFHTMLRQKHPDFMHRALRFIIGWDQDRCEREVVHIHGTKDRVIPYKHVEATYTIEGGMHLMVYSMGDTISQLVLENLPK